MPISGLEKKVMTASMEGKLLPHQECLLSEILACGNPASLAGGRASLRNSLPMALYAVVDALGSFIVSGQPDIPLLKKLLGAAGRAVAELKDVLPNDAILLSIEYHLSLLNAMDLSSKEEFDEIRTILDDIKDNLRSIGTAIKKLASTIWLGQPIPSHTTVELAAVEIVAWRADADSDYLSLVTDVRNLARSPNSKKHMQALLGARSSQFKVVVAVSGAKHLAKLDNFFDAVVQFTKGNESAAGWGAKTETLEEFTDITSQSSTTVFLQCRVAAADRHAARRAVRRRVSEVLDQYVAGHRLVDLRLHERTAVFDCALHSASHADGVMTGVAVGVPLTSDWPAHLRESLRAAHLAVRAESPMTQIALSWSSLEAAGFRPLDIQNLASALTLQTLRHQINESYLYVRQGVDIEREVLRGLIHDLCERNERTQHLLQQADDPRAKSSLTERIRLIEREQDRLGVMVDRHADIANAFDDVNDYIAIDSRGYPSSINSWVDLLLPNMLKPGLVPGRAYSAVRELQKNLRGLPQTRLNSWRMRISDASVFEKWCAVTNGHFEHILYRLYATRNVALHAGVVSVRGDTVLADAGIATVDLVHEILGNWTRVSEQQKSETLNMKPYKILKELSSRLQSVLTASRDGNMELVNFDYLTSPTSNSVDRIL